MSYTAGSASMTVEPQVFLSYVHDDDETFNGAVGKLRKRLENAYKTANGSKLRVFFDKDGIEWSMPWLDRLDIALADSWFLIPIVTPAYIESEQCCREFNTATLPQPQPRASLIVMDS
jgi:uncharacterized protein